jgi:DNA helicase-2/ATP-dependent DNA helicase PcrA
MPKLLNDNYPSSERHRAVVEHGKGLLVVVAGPGTGKTYSLLRKIESLIDSGVEPAQIYYITFVNSIVEAFKDDIRRPKDQGGLGVDPDELGIHISTLHSLAFKIVKVYSDRLGLPKHLEVIDLSPKRQSVLSQVFVGDLFAYAKGKGIVGDKKSLDRLLNKLTESWRCNRTVPSDCNDLAEVIRSLCQRYQVCPWDQLVLHAIRAVEGKGLPTWLKGAQHFLFDEYQDFNPSEQRLIELITEPSVSVIIVGDPDQSIYSGRSASPNGLRGLLERSDAKTVNFVYCRRCPKSVVTAANNLLRFMDKAGYAQKELQAYKDEQGEFGIQPFKNCKAEVDKLTRILQNLDKSQIKDAILLLPERRVAEYYAEKLNHSGVACSIKSADTAAELRDALLRLIILHHQPFLCRILLALFQNIERKFRDQVLAGFLGDGSSLADALTQASEDHKWQMRQKDSLRDFAASLDALTSNDAGLITSILTDLNNQVHKDLITCLLNSGPDKSARDRVTTCMEATAEDDQESDAETACLQVMTIHSSKGLSKQFVIIPAFDKKLLPGDNEGERLKEMHRLVYVAVTRAKGQVLITFPETRARGDPSIFGAKPKLSCYANILAPGAARLAAGLDSVSAGEFGE